MEFIWILFAFICGLAAKSLTLPPLIGYLAAGFLLNFLQVEQVYWLSTLADIGITLMLFMIGLKLNVKDLVKPEVWAGALGHMLVWVLVVWAMVVALISLSLPYFTEISLESAALLAFALSFSSTVCIVKALEEGGETKTRHGKLSIGVLVMQDIAAVIFLVVATGKIPSLWAIALLGLWFARKPVDRLLRHAGHGELMPLMGFFLALGSYELFELVGVKGDLGALIVGMLLSQSEKVGELSKSLSTFKDVFLIGFFLSIGFTALPDWSMVGVALLLVVLLSLKSLMFFLMFAGLRLRARTGYLSSLALSNYSEFGLIVAAVCVQQGLLSKEWLVILALAVSFSFVFTSILYPRAHDIYGRFKRRLRRFERQQRLAEDELFQPDTAEILVIGLGRVGKGAFHALHAEVGDRVWGMDADRDRIDHCLYTGMHVFAGDGEDADLWEKLNLDAIQLVLLALPSVEDSRNITVQLRHARYSGKVAAIARYEDEREALMSAGIDKVFNFFTEAGMGFAEESLQMIDV